MLFLTKPATYGLEAATAQLQFFGQSNTRLLQIVRFWVSPQPSRYQKLAIA
jgi:hypothetical protein